MTAKPIERTEATARTEQILRAAHEIAEETAFAQAMQARTGLSLAGVKLALREHIEQTPRGETLEALLASALPPSSETTVILAANVFTACVRAAVIAALHSEQVWLRPSRREPEFAAKLVARVAAPWLKLDAARRPLAALRGAVHVYGRGATIEQVRTALAPGVALHAHGPGFSAVYSESSDPAQLARAACADLVPFDQRGCLSPRLFLLRGAARARAFADTLARALDACHLRVPLGALSDDERAERRRYQDAWHFAAEALHSGPGGVVLLTQPGAPWQLSPVGRCAHVQPVADLAEAQRLLAPWATSLVALASDADFPADPAFSRVRRCAPGQLQRPPLDGPVDLRPLPLRQTTRQS